MLHDLDQLMERKEGRDMYLLWVPLICDVRTLMMDEAHASRSWWKIYFAALVDIVEGIENTAKNMRTTYHPQTDGQSERTIQTLKDMLRASHVLWAEIGEIRSIGPELIQETTNKLKLVISDVGSAVLKRSSAFWKERKYLADTNLHVHLEEIKVDKTLRFVEEPVEMINCEVKSLKRSRIPIVKSIGTRSNIMRIS
ncbi:putative reverse transcriptase domain-containing protein [Tanacetum coccineum]